MIENNRQYYITKNRIVMFEKAFNIFKVDKNKKRIDSRLAKAEMNALKSTLNELKKQAYEYENKLKRKKATIMLIKIKREYHAALREVERLIDSEPKKRSKVGHKLDLLAAEIRDYEKYCLHLDETGRR